MRYIWNDAKFLSLSWNAKGVFLFILTHPFITSIGALRATVEGLAAERADDLDAKAFQEAFQEALTKGLLEYQKSPGLIVAPKFIRHNPPQSPNVIIGWGAAIELLPECDLLTTHIKRLKAFSKGLPKAFQEAFKEAFLDTSPNKEQEQEQEQEHTARAKIEDSLENSQETLGKPSRDSLDRSQAFENWKPPLTFKNDGKHGREDEIESVGNEYRSFTRFLDRIAKDSEQRKFLGNRLRAHFLGGRVGIVIFIRGSEFDPSTIASTKEIAGLWTALSEFQGPIIERIQGSSAKMAGADIYFCFRDKVRKQWIAFTQEALNRLIVIKETGEVTTRKDGNGLPNI